jgi:hypothetical protein
VKFFKSGLNVIECDEGFSVEVLGRTGLRYREHDLVIFVDSEVLVGPTGLVIYSERINVESPTGKVLSNEDKSRTIENTRLAFRFDGFEIQVE